MSRLLREEDPKPGCRMPSWGYGLLGLLIVFSVITVPRFLSTDSRNKRIMRRLCNLTHVASEAELSRILGEPDAISGASPIARGGYWYEYRRVDARQFKWKKGFPFVDVTTKTTPEIRVHIFGRDKKEDISRLNRLFSVQEIYAQGVIVQEYEVTPTNHDSENQIKPTLPNRARDLDRHEVSALPTVSLLTTPIDFATQLSPITPENVSQVTKLAQIEQACASDILWKPDGTQFALLAWEQPVQVLDASHLQWVQTIGKGRKLIHFAFSRDLVFLKKAMPTLREAALFFVDFLVDDGAGGLTTSPSCSPENAFIDPTTGESVGLCEGSAMDLIVIRELFEYVLEGSELLGDRDEVVEEISAALKRLAQPKIGRDGRLLEYGIEAEEPEPTHRHLSHIYGAYPGWAYTPDQQADFYEASRKSLDARGDISTGWAMGWRVALWARFRDGDRTLAVIGNLLKFVEPSADVKYQGGGGLYANLWDAHPPFQIDGNFGVTAGIAEMLVQSHTGAIELLPALPTAWKNGSVTGLRARGGYEVDVTWQDGKLTRVVLRAISNSSETCTLRYGKESVTVELKPGEMREIDSADLAD